MFESDLQRSAAHSPGHTTIHLTADFCENLSQAKHLQQHITILYTPPTCFLAETFSPSDHDLYIRQSTFDRQKMALSEHYYNPPPPIIDNNIINNIQLNGEKTNKTYIHTYILGAKLITSRRIKYNT